MEPDGPTRLASPRRSPWPIARNIAVPDDRPISVLILYAHPLLGEGLARMFSSEPGLDVVAIQLCEAGMVERGLAASPDVIIFERGDPDRAIGILELAPEALVIDVGIDTGPAFTFHREEINARPEGILQAIRRVRMIDRDAVVGALAVLGVVAAAVGAGPGAVDVG
jgi:DNA-binding NarL/FixJ family response regulator